jgi:hypothetical protein
MERGACHLAAQTEVSKKSRLVGKWAINAIILATRDFFSVWAFSLTFNFIFVIPSPQSISVRAFVD